MQDGPPKVRARPAAPGLRPRAHDRDRRFGDQAVAVPIDDGTDVRKPAAQTLVAIPDGDLVAVDDCQRPARQLQVLVLPQVIQEVPLLRRPLAVTDVVSGDGDDSSLQGEQALQHIGVSDVPAVDRQVTVRHQDLHPRIQAAVGVRKNGHSNHGTDTSESSLRTDEPCIPWSQHFSLTRRRGEHGEREIMIGSSSVVSVAPCEMRFSL
jgi:hypothetical protein